jgi:hypothetical protein
MKGVFKCAMEDDERRSWSVKRSSLGIPIVVVIDLTIDIGVVMEL